MCMTVFTSVENTYFQVVPKAGVKKEIVPVYVIPARNLQNANNIITR